MAGFAVGAVHDLAAIDRYVGGGRVFEPDAERSESYDLVYASYRELYDRLRTFYPKLGRGGGSMSRRRLVLQAATLPFLRSIWPSALASSPAHAATPARSRVRPGDPAWPTVASWNRLDRAVGGRLIKVRSPLSACIEAPSGPDCGHVLKELRNPYFLGDEVGAHADARLGRRLDVRPSAYAVAARVHGRRRGRRRLRPREQAAPRRQGRRPQLSGHVQRGGLAADLDAAMTTSRARRVRRLPAAPGEASRSRPSRSGPAPSGGGSTTPSRPRRAATSRAAAA